ncbi:hypothetical protein IM043_gp240 [Bacillus phage SPG24]|nr:hypothetical protein IM043_gp240 [Bacillus phage SPG24]
MDRSYPFCECLVSYRSLHASLG